MEGLIFIFLLQEAFNSHYGLVCNNGLYRVAFSVVLQRVHINFRQVVVLKKGTLSRYQALYRCHIVIMSICLVGIGSVY